MVNARHHELLMPIENNDYLSLSIYYNLGGYNYFNSENTPRGIYLGATPVTVTAETRTSTISLSHGDIKKNGFKVLLKELKRKNQKDINRSFSVLEDSAAELFACWFRNDSNGVLEGTKGMKKIINSPVYRPTNIRPVQGVIAI